MLDNNKKSTINTIDKKDFSSAGSFMKNKGLVPVNDDDDERLQQLMAMMQGNTTPSKGNSGIGSVL